ncbi:MAG: hypothetical protein IH851_13690 [Armatimonadetes bacterium]|nr:hypothetical protein [Armatimonadota bacterium]
MFASALVCLCVAGSFVATDVIEIPVTNRRPSRIMQNLMPEGVVWSSIPQGVTAKADDAKGVIVAEGPAKGLEELRERVAHFDITPETISVRIEVDSDYDSEDFAVIGELRHYSSFTLSENQTGVHLSLVSRINGDGTITFGMGYGLAGEDSSLFTIRVKVGTALVLAPSVEGIKEESGKVYFWLGEKLAGAPIVTITVLEVK